MKWLIASDIHGSAYYCEKLLEAYRREGADKMLLLGDILLHGHTHVPACEQQDGYMYLNPGSVSIPKENSPHSYMVFDGRNFEWKVLDGEREGEVYENYTCCRRNYSQR